MGSLTGLDASGGITIALAGDVEVPGTAVSPSADANDDGYADVLVSGGGDGTVLLIFGQADVEAPFTVRSFSNSTAVSFGKAASFIGDVNGDGHVDLMITAPKEGTVSPGWLYVFSGSAVGPLVDNVTAFESGLRYSEAGGEVVALGDLNEDGYDDVLVRFDRSREGVLLALGSAVGLTLDKTSFIDARYGGSGGFPFVQAPAQVHLAGGGDINGDGVPDLLYTLAEFDTAVGVYGSAILWGEADEEATPSPGAPSPGSPSPSPSSSTTTTTPSYTETTTNYSSDDDDVSTESTTAHTTTTTKSVGGDVESTIGTDPGEDENSLPLPLLIGGGAVALLLLFVSLAFLLRRRARGRLQRHDGSVKLSSGRHSTRSRSASHSSRAEA
uniref:Integrin alpha-2 domain-containing protein n=1 Tax=Sexangularia sp. CB-2014 TaxID=1486929 RepID=A0A6U0HNU3_9EUKA